MWFTISFTKGKGRPQPHNQEKRRRNNLKFSIWHSQRDDVSVRRLHRYTERILSVVIAVILRRPSFQEQTHLSEKGKANPTVSWEICAYSVR